VTAHANVAVLPKTAVVWAALRVRLKVQRGMDVIGVWIITTGLDTSPPVS